MLLGVDQKYRLGAELKAWYIVPVNFLFDHGVES